MLHTKFKSPSIYSDRYFQLCDWVSHSVMEWDVDLCIWPDARGTAKNRHGKFHKVIFSRTGNMPLFVLFQQGSKRTNRLTDIQEIWNYSEIVYKHSRNVSKRFQKYITKNQSYKKAFNILYPSWYFWKSQTFFRMISHPELEISLYLSNFSKKVSQLTDWQAYKKFRIIWK